jgi:hypothetical protein
LEFYIFLQLIEKCDEMRGIFCGDGGWMGLMGVSVEVVVEGFVWRVGKWAGSLLRLEWDWDWSVFIDLYACEW